MGDREKNLRTAIAALSGAGVRVTRVSSFYETEPLDLRDQPWFLNCVVEGVTEVPAVTLLKELRKTEAQMGSKKVVAKGPRLIDLDILLYGDETIDTPDLHVPHARMMERRFVLVPLAELAPGLTHPSWGATAAEALARVKDRSEVRPWQAGPPGS